MTIRSSEALRASLRGCKKRRVRRYVSDAEFLNALREVLGLDPLYKVQTRSRAKRAEP